ncbi:MAG: hypothetical protein WDZ32_01230 [Candidatus Saccharimonadales bacterium]
MKAHKVSVIILSIFLALSVIGNIYLFINSNKSSDSETTNLQEANKKAESPEDFKRKKDVDSLYSDTVYFINNNNGEMPTTPWVSGMTYKLDIVSEAVSGQAPTKSQAEYSIGTDCEGKTGLRNFSIKILLSDNTVYCKGA